MSEYLARAKGERAMSAHQREDEVREYLQRCAPRGYQAVKYGFDGRGQQDIPTEVRSAAWFKEATGRPDVLLVPDQYDEEGENALAQALAMIEVKQRSAWPVSPNAQLWLKEGDVIKAKLFQSRAEMEWVAATGYLPGTSSAPLAHLAPRYWFLFALNAERSGYLVSLDEFLAESAYVRLPIDHYDTTPDKPAYGCALQPGALLRHRWVDLDSATPQRCAPCRDMRSLAEAGLDSPFHRQSVDVDDEDTRVFLAERDWDQVSPASWRSDEAPPTEKQHKFIKDLCKRLGIPSAVARTKSQASAYIDQLQHDAA